MPPPIGSVETGREYPRRIYQCASCHIRNAIGDPNVTATWAARLHLDAEQLDLLTLAAAEFDDLCAKAGDYSVAVDFVDWVRPDALATSFSSPANARVQTNEDRHR